MDELQNGADVLILDTTISDQVNFLYEMQGLDFSELYDAWNESKIKAVETAMDIIHRRQKQILAEIKAKG